MKFHEGDKVVVVKPTEGLPAFVVSGQVYTIFNIIQVGEMYALQLRELRGEWSSTRFEKYETKRV